MAVKAIPEGFHTLTPSLSLEGAADAIAFFQKALGAKELMRAPDPSGKRIWHAHLTLGSSAFFVNDVFPDMGGKPFPASLWVYVEDVDAAFKRAVDAGANAMMPPADMFWGDRMGKVSDRWGNEWTFAQHVKDMTPEEMKRAQDEMVRQFQQKKP